MLMHACADKSCGQSPGGIRSGWPSPGGMRPQDRDISPSPLRPGPMYGSGGGRLVQSSPGMHRYA
eukprot:2281240-Rhodomonas_salina.4